MEGVAFAILVGLFLIGGIILGYVAFFSTRRQREDLSRVSADLAWLKTRLDQVQDYLKGVAPILPLLRGLFEFVVVFPHWVPAFGLDVGAQVKDRLSSPG